MNVQLSSPQTTESENPFTGLREFVADMARLLDTAASAEAFDGEFLPRVLSLAQAAGGAIWRRGPQDDWQLQSQTNLADLQLEKHAGALASHRLLLRQAGQRDKAFWVAPQNNTDKDLAAVINPTQHALLLAPVLVEKQIVGIIEIWQETMPELARRRLLARLLMEVATFEAAYLHKSQWKNLLDRQQLLVKLEAFTRQIHGSLEPKEVAYLLANECRRILACDQVSVLWRRGKSTRVVAVSGSPGIDKQSRLVQCMQSLGNAVLAWGEKLTFAGQSADDWPPDVVKALDDYVRESNSRSLLVVPLHHPRDKAHGQACSWGLLVESFGPAESLQQWDGALELLAPHAASALHNAGQWQQLPLRSLTVAIAGFRDGISGRKWAKIGMVIGIVTLLIGLCVFLQVPCRREAKGQLVPLYRQVVYAPLAGKIVELKAQPGEIVAKGQELLFLEDLETQLQVDQLNVKIAASEQKLAFLSEQIGKATSQDERVSLTKERLAQDYDLRKAVAERDILLSASRSPRKSPVPAPIDGKLVTFDAYDQLLGKTVKPGDPLLRIAKVKGLWEIELYIPEANIHLIRETLDKTSAGELDVDLLLLSQPQRTFKGKLRRDGLGGETIVKDNRVVLPARARITDPELAGQVDELPVGVELRAKVRCGRRSLGYVWFAELWEFLYENLFF